jgi:hypothetical protein
MVSTDGDAIHQGSVCRARHSDSINAANRSDGTVRRTAIAKSQ